MQNNSNVQPARTQSKRFVNANKVSFGNAPTSVQLKDLSNLLDFAQKNILNLNHRAMIFFQNLMPAVPSKNPGNGTINSRASINYIKKMKDLTGIDSIQLGPHGIIPGITLSPYSGTTFSLNHRSIDLEQLTGDRYGRILNKSSEKLSTLYDSQKHHINNYKIDLETKYHVDTFFDPVLDEAYEGFKKLDKNHPLKIEYQDYVNKNADNWLQKDALYQAFSVENTPSGSKYVNDYWPKWHNDIDKNIFGSLLGTPQANERIAQVSQKHSDVVENYKFRQFIAETQLRETKKELNNYGIKVNGDCPIVTSPRDQWGNLKDFEPDKYLGCRDTTTGEFYFWDAPLWKNADVIEKKFDRLHDLYDGVRADAGWEYQRSIAYTADRKNIWDIQHSRDVLDRLNASARKHGHDLTLNSLENSAGPYNADGQLSQLNKEGYPIPEIVITAYNEFADQQLPHSWAALTTHDTNSALNITHGDTNRITDWIAGLYKGPNSTGRGSSNVLLNSFDVLGKSESINGYKNGADNFANRIDPEPERLYFEQMSKGYGYNMPEIIKRAIVYKIPDNQRNEKINEAIVGLDYFSKLFRRNDGSMTVEDADKAIKNSYQLSSTN